MAVEKKTKFLISKNTIIEIGSVTQFLIINKIAVFLHSFDCISGGSWKHISIID